MKEQMRRCQRVGGGGGDMGRCSSFIFHLLWSVEECLLLPVWEKDRPRSSFMSAFAKNGRNYCTR